MSDTFWTALFGFLGLFLVAAVNGYWSYKNANLARESKAVSVSNAKKLDTVVSQKVTAVSTQQLSSAELERELQRRDAQTTTELKKRGL